MLRTWCWYDHWQQEFEDVCLVTKRFVAQWSTVKEDLRGWSVAKANVDDSQEFQKGCVLAWSSVNEEQNTGHAVCSCAEVERKHFGKWALSLTHVEITAVHFLQGPSEREEADWRCQLDATGSAHQLGHARSPHGKNCMVSRQQYWTGKANRLYTQHGPLSWLSPLDSVGWLEDCSDFADVVSTSCCQAGGAPGAPGAPGAAAPGSAMVPPMVAQPSFSMVSL